MIEFYVLYYSSGQKLIATEAIGPRVELTSVILLNERIFNCYINIYAYNHRTGVLSILVWEVSFCSSYWPMDRCIIAQSANIKRLDVQS